MNNTLPAHCRKAKKKVTRVSYDRLVLRTRGAGRRNYHRKKKSTKNARQNFRMPDKSEGTRYRGKEETTPNLL